jgi:hypothetical protein
VLIETVEAWKAVVKIFCAIPEEIPTTSDEILFVNVEDVERTFWTCKFVSARRPVESVFMKTVFTLIVPAEIVLARRVSELAVPVDSVSKNPAEELIVPAKIESVIREPTSPVPEEIKSVN